MIRLNDDDGKDQRSTYGRTEVVQSEKDGSGICEESDTDQEIKTQLKVFIVSMD